MDQDIRQIVEAALLVFAALLPIVNPLGAAPVFLAMTSDCTPALRASLANRIAINAFVLLLGSLFIGTWVLEFFGLSVPIVQVAGGIVVCAAGWDLLRQHEEDRATGPEPAPSATEMARRAFYPLTLPLTVGPGSISVAITIGANHPHSMRSLVVNAFGNLAGVTLTAATIFVCFRYSERIMRGLGATGASVVMRLSAFILLCIGVQIFWNGAYALLATVPILSQR